MFDTYKVSELKKMLSQHRSSNTIVGYSTMKKAALIAELKKKFSIVNNKLVLKGEVIRQPVQVPVVREKKRIQPQLVAVAPAPNPAFQLSAVAKARTKGQERVENTISSLEKRYRHSNIDEEPSLSFRLRK